MLPLGPYSWSCCLHHQGQYWETSSITSNLWPTLSIDILPAGCLVVLGIHRSDQKMNKTGYSQIKRLIKLVKWKYTKVQIYRENQKLLLGSLRVDTSVLSGINVALIQTFSARSVRLPCLPPLIVITTIVEEEEIVQRNHFLWRTRSQIWRI